MYGGVYNEVMGDTYANDVEPPSISSLTRRCKTEVVPRIIKAVPLVIQDTNPPLRVEWPHMLEDR